MDGKSVRALTARFEAENTEEPLPASPAAKFGTHVRMLPRGKRSVHSRAGHAKDTLPDPTPLPNPDDVPPLPVERVRQATHQLGPTSPNYAIIIAKVDGSLVLYDLSNLFSDSQPQDRIHNLAEKVYQPDEEILSTVTKIPVPSDDNNPMNYIMKRHAFIEKIKAMALYYHNKYNVLHIIANNYLCAMEGGKEYIERQIDFLISRAETEYQNKLYADAERAAEDAKTQGTTLEQRMWGLKYDNPHLAGGSRRKKKSRKSRKIKKRRKTHKNKKRIKSHKNKKRTKRH